MIPTALHTCVVLCPAVLRATPGLRELRLPQCARVTGAAIEQLPALVPHLTCALHSQAQLDRTTLSESLNRARLG